MARFERHVHPLVQIERDRVGGCQTGHGGKAYLRRVPVDSSYRLDIDALRPAVSADRAAGQ
jgi:hypothetical protein